MSTARLLTIWFGLAFTVGGILGLALIEPGGVPTTGAEEFGRRILAPILFGAGVAIVLSSPIGVIAAVFHHRRQRTVR